jgi:hypothetical protein
VNYDEEQFDPSSFDKIRIYAGRGSDTVRLYGSARVLVFGGDGNDHIESDHGNDTLLGEAGNDYLYAGAGNDLLVGGTGDDSLYGDAGDDTLSGENGNDSLKGGDGNDRISGGNGNDVLYDGWGTDVLFGNNGADRFVCRDSSRGWKDRDPGEVIEKDPVPPIVTICGCFTYTLTHTSLITRPA